MAALPLHPRLAHMALRAREMGIGGLACELAALLSERDVFRRGDGPPDADLRLRLEALRDLASNRRVRGSADAGALRRVLAEAREWRRRLGVRGEMAIRPPPGSCWRWRIRTASDSGARGGRGACCCATAAAPR